MSLYFIALLPPETIQEQVNEIKQHFAEKYASRAALKSPPHITLQPPFEWEDGEISIVETTLAKFTLQHQPIAITLNGFAAFPPRVIYINVGKIPALTSLQANLMADLATNLGIVDESAKNRPFSPHLTVAYRDLTKQNFRTAWPEFAQRQLYFEFTATHLTLLRHDGRRWDIKSELLFAVNS